MHTQPLFDDENARKLTYSKVKSKKFLRAPIAGGGDPLPHPPPTQPKAVRGRCATVRPPDPNSWTPPVLGTDLRLWMSPYAIVTE